MARGAPQSAFVIAFTQTELPLPAGPASLEIAGCWLRRPSAGIGADVWLPVVACEHLGGFALAEIKRRFGDGCRQRGLERFAGAELLAGQRIACHVADAVGEVFGNFGYRVHDALARRWFVLEQAGDQEACACRKAQRHQRILADVFAPVERRLDALAEFVYGFRNRIALGGDVLANRFGAALRRLTDCAPLRC